MRQQHRIFRFPIPLVGLTALLLIACSRGTDEEQIRDVIDTAEKAAESRKTSAVMDLVADDYRDDLGLDKTQLESYLRAYFFTHPKIELLVNIKDVTIESAGSARVHLELSMIGTVIGGDSTSLTADSKPLRVDFKRNDGKWMVVRVARRRD